MATELQIFDFSLQAADDYEEKQFYIMALDSDGRAEIAGDADVDTIGILQNKPGQYEAAEIRRVGISKVVCGNNIAIGKKIVPDADGKAVEGGSTERYCAIALETGASGRVISVLMEFGKV